QEMQANQGGRGPADEEQRRDRNQVKDCDSLVVGREEPRFPAVRLGEEVRLRRLGRVRKKLPGRGLHGDAHGFFSAIELGAPPGAGSALFRRGVCPGPSDRRNAINWNISSSLTCPWNDGMSGSHPSTTSLLGVRIESRR